MRLVKLTYPQNREVWVNPDAVGAVTVHPSDPARTQLILIDGSRLNVVEPLSTVVPSLAAASHFQRPSQ